MNGESILDSQFGPTTPPPENSLPKPDLLDQQFSGVTSQAQAVNGANTDVHPDLAARAAAVGKQYGLSPSAILPNLDKWESRAALDQNNAAVQNDPKLAMAISTNPNLAAVGKDDYEHLSFLGHGADTLASTLENRLGVFGAQQGWRDLTDWGYLNRLEQQSMNGGHFEPTAGTVPRPDEDLYNFNGTTYRYVPPAKPEPAPISDIGAFASTALQSYQGMVGRAYRAIGEQTNTPLSPFFISFGKSLENPTLISQEQAEQHPISAELGEQAASVAPMLLRSAAIPFYALTGGQQEKEIAEAEGKAAPEQQKAFYAGLAGNAALMGLMHMVGGEAPVLRTEAGIRPYVAAKMQQAMNSAPLGVAMGEGQELIHSYISGDQYEPDISRMLASGVSFGALGMIAPTQRAYLTREMQDFGNYAHSKALAQQFSDLADGAAESTTRERSPEIFNDYIGNRLGDNTNVYLPADKVNALYQSEKKTPGPDDGVLGKAVPDIAAQMVQAQQTGGDIVIPASSYMTHVAGTAADNTLRQDARLTQDGMSANDIKEYETGMQERLEQVGKTIADQQESPERRIYDDMRDQVRAAGRTPTEADHAARMTAMLYSHWGEQLGRDPWEMYQREPLFIRQGAAGEEPGAALAFAMNKIKADADAAKSLVANGEAASPDRTVEKGIASGDTVQYQKEGSTKEELFAKAEKNQKPYTKWVKDMTAGIKGANPYTEGLGGKSGVRVKHREGRIDEKIAEKNGNAGAVSDYLGGAIEVSNPQALQQVIDRIRASGKKIIEAEDMLTSDDKYKNDGYRAIHMQVELEPGFSAELQLLPKAVAKIKETMHTEYKKLRDAEEANQKGSKPASWVIKNKNTGEIIMETFDRKKVDALNTEKYVAVPILEHLQGLNKKPEELPRAPQGLKNPVLNFLKARGGIEKGSALDAEIKSMGNFSPRFYGKKGTALRDVDNIPLSEWQAALDAGKDDGNGYVDREHVLNAIREELFGKPIRNADEKIVLDHGYDRDYAAHLAEQSSQEEFERINSEIADYHEQAMRTFDEQEKEFLASRGEAWEPDQVKTRTLEDLENEFKQESAARESQPGARGLEQPGFTEGTEGRSAEGGQQRGNAPESATGQAELAGTAGSGQQLAAAHEGRRLRADVGQKAADEGLFDTGARNQKELFQSELTPAQQESREKLVTEYDKAFQKFIGGNELFQGEGTPRASLTREDGKRILTLFEKADKSSLMHELAHIWLDEFSHYAAASDAPEKFKSDWAKASEFIGHTGTGEIGREAHEKWATAFESYLMEGKSPSRELLPVFRSYKSWLTRIYKAVKNIMGAPELSDDIRSVFDRMLASDEQINEMRTRQGIDQLFKTKDAGGMTDAEFKAYNEAAQNFTDKAKEQLLSEAMEKVKKQDTKAWNAADEKLRPEIEDRVRAMQGIRAIDWFRTGVLRDENGNEAEVPKMALRRDSLAPGVEDSLPRSVKVLNKGATPEEIAPILGYESGDAMLRDLMEFGRTEQAAGRQSLVKFLTDHEVTQALQQRFGIDPAEMQRRAEAMMTEHGAIDLKLAELRYLARKAGRPVTFTKEAIASWADNRLNGMQASEAAKTWQYVRAAAKAGRDAQRAVMKDDTDGGIQALQRQMLNMALAERSRDFAADYQSGMRFLKKTGATPTRTSTDQAYMDQAHGILQRIGIAVKRDPGELADALKNAPLKQFIEQKAQNGYSIAATDEVVDGTMPNIGKQSVTQFRDVTDAVQSLLHNGREEKTITVGEKKVAKEKIINEIVDNLQKFRELKGPNWIVPKDAPLLDRALDQIGSVTRGGKASLAKMERLFTWMDQDNALGPLNTYVFRPLKDGFLKEFDLQREAEAALERVPTPKGWEKTLTEKVPEDPRLIDPDTGRPVQISRKNLLKMALDAGNRGPGSNFDKLIKGYNWDGQVVDDYLKRNMTKPDWDVVTALWNSFEQNWPAIAEMERRLSGVAPPKVKATPIDTPYGTVPGGYSPIIYDRNKSVKHDAYQDAEALFDKDYFRPATPKGHTIARVLNYSDKINLDLDLIPGKMKQALHDLGMREAVINANKILSDPRVLDAVNRTWGREYSKLFRPWLKDIANGPNSDDRPMGFFDKTMRYSRTAVTQVGVGFRISTPFLHGSSAAVNSVDQIGAKAFAAGLQEYYSDRAGKLQWVLNTSHEVRTRMDNYDRDARLALIQKLGEDTMMNNFRRYSTYAIAHLDRESAVPTWIGAFRKAELAGKEHDDAVYIADKAVRDAHGAQTPIDTAAIQRGSEGFKMFTIFYGFFDNTLNRIANYSMQAQKAAAQGNYYDTAKILAHTIAYTTLLAAIHGTFKGNLWSGEDSFAKRLAMAEGEFFMSLLPLTRDAASYLEYGHGSGTPLERMVESVAGTAKNIEHGVTGQKVEDKWMRHAIETAGYITDAPTGQVAVSGQYLWDVWNGKENPRDVQQWIHGLIYGTNKPPKK